ncbi:MAG: DNA polymerase I, partial [Chloroflexota bacterium]
GEITNATFGFTSMLLDVLRDHHPEFIIVTFDVGLTFRHEQYADYKAHRTPMPDELRPQIDRMREVLAALNIPIYEADGFEADDVIGTLACQASEANIETYVVTGDSDLLQLVNDHVRVVMPGAQRFGEYRIFDEAAVHDRYGFGPERVSDYKALVGDKSDNIPGVPGVGDKTAKALIKQFESLDDMYEHLDEIEPARARNAIAKNRDAAYESRDLVTVVCDVPVDLDLERCRVHDFDRARAVSIFQDLEFRTLLAKLPDADPAGDGNESAPPALPTATVTIVTDESQLECLASDIRDAEAIAVDVETSGLDPMRCDLVGIAIATSEDDAYYVPTKHEGGPNAEREKVLAYLQSPLRDHPCVMTHNGKFDLMVLQRYGFEDLPIHADSMLSAYILGENNLGLKDLAFQRLGWEMAPITDLIGTGRNQTTMDQVSVEKAAQYAAADVEATLKLERLLRIEIEKREQARLLDEIELQLIPVLIEMERTGIALDVEFLTSLAKQLQSQIDKIRLEIYASVGHEFNLNSPQQLAHVLFEELGLPAGRRTKSGYSVAQGVLEGLIGAHEIIDLILEYRQLAKLQSTYVESLPLQVNPETGRVHTTFNQTIAATGRLSSTDPNLQNIPVRTEIGRQVRRAFIADYSTLPGVDSETVFFGADYSQMELRLMAHFSEDESLVQAFQEGQDIHATTAAEVFGVPLDQVTPRQRSDAKVVNFGIMYGMGAWGLARDTGMPQDEAQKFIDRYYERFQGVARFIGKTIEETERKGYASTLYGRRRYLPDITASGPRKNAAIRAAINMPIQGTAADIMKLAMLDVHRRLQSSNLKSRMLLQVHDELIFEAPHDEIGELREIVTRAMANVAELLVPLEVEPKLGPNWEEMRPIE